MKDEEPSDNSTEWFRRSFDDFYLSLYSHRDDAEAARLVQTLSERFGFDGRVLDVACGAGRFLRALRTRGVEATGLDLSPALLREARRLMPLPSPSLVRADMRQLPIRTAGVAWVLLLFTSFGYFDSAPEDRLALSELSRVLRPGGRLVIDYLNPETTVGRLVPESIRFVAGRTVRETRWVDPRGPFLRKRIELAAAEDLPAATYEERVRLYSPPQLRALLVDAGLQVDEIWGDYDGAPFVLDRAGRCLLLARQGER